MPRPKLPEQNRRSRHVMVAVTPGEYAEIYSRAKYEGRSMSQWIRTQLDLTGKYGVTYQDGQLEMDFEGD